MTSVSSTSQSNAFPVGERLNNRIGDYGKSDSVAASHKAAMKLLQAFYKTLTNEDFLVFKTNQTLADLEVNEKTKMAEQESRVCNESFWQSFAGFIKNNHKKDNVCF
jgi:hypothetical protein